MVFLFSLIENEMKYAHPHYATIYSDNGLAPKKRHASSLPMIVQFNYRYVLQSPHKSYILCGVICILASNCKLGYQSAMSSFTSVTLMDIFEISYRRCSSHQGASQTKKN